MKREARPDRGEENVPDIRKEEPVRECEHDERELVVIPPHLQFRGECDHEEVIADVRKLKNLRYQRRRKLGEPDGRVHAEEEVIDSNQRQINIGPAD